MKPITINFPGKYIDGYIYLGRLFLVEMDGTISSVSMDTLIAQIKVNDLSNVLKTAFLRNDWLSNQQGRSFFQMPGQLNNFKILWNRLAKAELIIDSSKFNLSKHFEVPDSPIFDIRAYGLKLYMGNRNGLYESQFITDGDKFKNVLEPKKIFDARTTFLSAKSGELMISSNSDGLFRGKVRGVYEKTEIINKPLAEKSIRTGWATYDVLNYESQNDFVYYVNEVAKSESQPRTPYSNNDENSIKKEITRFGISEYKQEDILPDNLINAQIKYSFNSSNYCFLLNSDNILYRSTFIKDINNLHLSKKSVIENNFEKLLKLKGKTKIISTALVPSGVIIETLSSVVLTTSALKPTILHDRPIFALKTLLSSKRFKNLVLVFHESGLSIHSLFPVDI